MATSINKLSLGTNLLVNNASVKTASVPKPKPTYQYALKMVDEYRVVKDVNLTLFFIKFLNPSTMIQFCVTRMIKFILNMIKEIGMKSG